MHLLTGVGLALLPERLPWRRRYFAGLRRFRDAGIAATADEDAGVMDYSSLRAQWDRHIVVLARYMAFDLHDVDPKTSDPEGVARRADFSARLRSTG
jgi:hypothetical protein